MNDLPATIELADAVVVTLVCSGTSLLVGLVWGRREKAATQRQRVAERRANRLRHRAPEPEEPQGPGPVVDEPVVEGEIVSVDIPARRRMTGLAAGSSVPSAAQTLLAERYALRSEAKRMAAEGILHGPLVAAVYGETREVPLPIFAEAVALCTPTGQYPTLRTSPENPVPNDPGGAPRPAKFRKRKKHAHGGAR